MSTTSNLWDDRIHDMKCMYCGSEPDLIYDNNHLLIDIRCKNPECCGSISLRDFRTNRRVTVFDLWNYLNRVPEKEKAEQITENFIG
ncbi:hypothetical protein JW935_15730 [candidate division KSB1 bacterium]|nr:hypothetical protein [candidate division KSB1 bacterium]